MGEWEGRQGVSISRMHPYRMHHPDGARLKTANGGGQAGAKRMTMVISIWMNQIVHTFIAYHGIHQRYFYRLCNKKLSRSGS